MQNLEQQKIISGVVTEDPSINPEVGTVIAFQGIIVKILPDNISGSLENFATFGGVLLSLHFGSSDTHEVEGSAVMVGPGIALGARHVIEPHLKYLIKGEKHAMALGATECGMQIWTVRHVTLVSGSDIVILGLELISKMPDNNVFCVAQITTRLPKLNERVQITGIRANSATRITEEACGGYSMGASLRVSAGNITNRYREGRDSCFITWPVLEVDCPSWGGMSGGPVFDESGLLVGLLCTSFSGNQGLGPSYVSLLWPALPTMFLGGWPTLAFPGTKSLNQLANQSAPRCCMIDRPEATHIEHDEITGETYVVYTSWE